MNAGVPFQLTSIDEQYALSRAYVPEHIPSMMSKISHASPFLIENYLGFAKDNWLCFIGYPLGEKFSSDHCGELIARILKERSPDYLWFIGPEIPSSLARFSRIRQSDQYFRVDLSQTAIKPSLQREVNQAARTLTVERSRVFTDEHISLVDELMRREKLPPMIAELYRVMPDYVGHCETAYTLNARDARGKLAAFFVVELAAEQFDTYMLGCYSKKNYTPHASDLLFSEMIAFARERGKTGINLGLGVNDGIRDFKMKWGGKPYLNYEFCECCYAQPALVSVMDMLLGNIP
jgi:hypothetical protein